MTEEEMREVEGQVVVEAMAVEGGVEEAKGKIRGPWSDQEDAILSALVGKFGARNWSLIARGIPGRSGKSCRLRWCNQLDPCVMRKPFTGYFFVKRRVGFLWVFIFALFLLCLRYLGLISIVLFSLVLSLVLIKILDSMLLGIVLGSEFGLFALFDVGSEGIFIQVWWCLKIAHNGKLGSYFFLVYYAKVFAKRSSTPLTVQMLPNISIDWTKASSEDTLSGGGPRNSFKPSEEVETRSVSINHPKNPEYETLQIGGPSTSALEIDEVGLIEDLEKKYEEDKTQTCVPKQNPSVSRPIAKVGGFDIYNSCSDESTFSGAVLPITGSMIRPSKMDLGICKKFLDVGASCDGDRIIPLQCGYGCCSNSTTHSSRSSLLGPEFVDYEETPSFSSHELTSAAADLNNMAWIRSGLENSRNAKRQKGSEDKTTSNRDSDKVGDLCKENQADISI
ncbi:hypothetical protein MIMGU_mgv1a006317mg [Erythranthe guttata]|uniref:Uncharacterized protein n=1 Tax=Erythranthe guttata TaxID=4155 RepID=A0A022PUC5_ERYGU|nr:hypothetical protein MIMGU_mgv1a006317mg [Erythranthe guttata]